MSGQTRDVVSAFVRVLNNGDERFIADLLDPDFVDRTPTLKQDEGPQAFIAQKLRNLREAFPDLTLGIDDTIVEGDRIAWRWTLRGTNTNLGEFAGRPPTGRAVEFQGLNIERIDGGTIIEHWSIYDSATLLDQLGLFELPG